MVDFNFPGEYSNFSTQLTRRDREIIRENDKELTKVNGKKISLGNLGIVSAAGGATGYGTGKLTNMLRQKKAGLKMTGQGAKAKLIGAGIGGALSGGLSYYLQTRDTDGRSDKGKKRIRK